MSDREGEIAEGHFVARLHAELKEGFTVAEVDLPTHDFEITFSDSKGGPIQVEVKSCRLSVSHSTKKRFRSRQHPKRDCGDFRWAIGQFQFSRDDDVRQIQHKLNPWIVFMLHEPGELIGEDQFIILGVARAKDVAKAKRGGKLKKHYGAHIVRQVKAMPWGAWLRHIRGETSG